MSVLPRRGLRACAERVPFAEEVHGAIVVSHATVGRERHLVRPVAIGRRLVELSITIEHRHLH